MGLADRSMTDELCGVLQRDHRLHVPPDSLADVRHATSGVTPGAGGTMQSHFDEHRYTEQLAVGLGWFSIGLGVAELTAPRSVARLIGAPDDDATLSLLRVFGAREIGSGLAILSEPDRPAWMWSRVGGDMIDLAALGAAMRSDRADLGRLAAAAAFVAGATAIDAYTARQLSEAGATPGARARRAEPRETRVRAVTTINKPIEQVYAFWRRFENFPQFMRHIESIEAIDERRSRWRATAPAGATVSWEAELVEDRENEQISWRSVEGSSVRHHGSVHFAHAPGARGTEVRVELAYQPPAGALGRGVAWLFGEEPGQQIHEDLHRFKQLMETGEIPLSEGPGLRRPAQPAPRPEQLRNLAGVQR
jgi:uncharacterized membrane protein